MDDKEVNACDIGLAMLQGNMVGRKTGQAHVAMLSAGKCRKR